MNADKIDDFLEWLDRNGCIVKTCLENPTATIVDGVNKPKVIVSLLADCGSKLARVTLFMTVSYSSGESQSSSFPSETG